MNSYLRLQGWRQITYSYCLHPQSDSCDSVELRKKQNSKPATIAYNETGKSKLVGLFINLQTFLHQTEGEAFLCDRQPIYAHKLLSNKVEFTENIKVQNIHIRTCFLSFFVRVYISVCIFMFIIYNLLMIIYLNLFQSHHISL